MIILVLPHMYEGQNNLDVKGFGLAKMVQILQGEPFVFSFSSGSTGKEVRKAFAKSKIQSSFVITQKESEISTSEYKEFKQNLFNIKECANVIVVDENLFLESEKTFFKDVLKSFSNSHYKVIMNLVKNKDDHMSMDIVKPYLINVTIDDSNKLWKESSDVIIKAFIDYIHKGVRYIVINVVGKMKIFVSKNKICYIEEKENNMNDCAEALLGALAVGVERKYEYEKIAKLAFSAYDSTIQTQGIAYCSRNNILINKKKHKLIEIKENKKSFIQKDLAYNKI